MSYQILNASCVIVLIDNIPIKLIKLCRADLQTESAVVKVTPGPMEPHRFHELHMGSQRAQSPSARSPFELLQA